MSVPIEFFSYEEMREHIFNGGLPPSLVEKKDDAEHKTLSKRDELEIPSNLNQPSEKETTPPKVPLLNLPRDRNEEMRHVAALARIINNESQN